VTRPDRTTQVHLRKDPRLGYRCPAYTVAGGVHQTGGRLQVSVVDLTDGTRHGAAPLRYHSHQDQHSRRRGVVTDRRTHKANEGAEAGRR